MAAINLLVSGIPLTSKVCYLYFPKSIWSDMIINYYISILSSELPKKDEIAYYCCVQKNSLFLFIVCINEQEFLANQNTLFFNHIK